MGSHATSVPSPFGPEQVAAWLEKLERAKRESELLFVLQPEVELEPAGLVLLRSLPRAWIFQAEEVGWFEQAASARDLREARVLADRFGDVLEAELGEQVASTLRAARFSIEELAANVVQHSEQPETGFGAVRAFPEAGRFQFAFADRGVGLRASLEKNPELAGRVENDARAIQLALAKGVSRNGSGNMGIGLDFLKGLSDRLAGDLWIASGRASLHRCGPREARRDEIRATAPWEGVWVCLDTPARP